MPAEARAYLHGFLQIHLRARFILGKASQADRFGRNVSTVMMRAVINNGKTNAIGSNAVSQRHVGHIQLTHANFKTNGFSLVDHGFDGSERFNNSSEHNVFSCSLL